MYMPYNPPKEPHSAELELTVVKQVYSFTLTPGIKRFLVRCRNSNVPILISYENEALNSDSPPGPYFTIRNGEQYYEDEITIYNNTELYFKCMTDAGVVLEIVYWE